MEPDDYLCSRNARPEPALWEMGEWRWTLWREQTPDLPPFPFPWPS